jgi:hypothetical protein
MIGRAGRLEVRGAPAFTTLAGPTYAPAIVGTQRQSGRRECPSGRSKIPFEMFERFPKAVRLTGLDR